MKTNKTYCIYVGHLLDYNVKVGDKVKRGDVLGTIDTTGEATGPHIHCEVWEMKLGSRPTKYTDGYQINPCGFLFRHPSYQSEKVDNIKDVSKEDTDSFILPSTPRCWLSQGYNKKKHPGIDLGFYKATGWKNTKAIASNDGVVCGRGSGTTTGKFIIIACDVKAETVIVPNPVERDILVPQIEVFANQLRIRKAPNGLTWNAYCKNGIFNIFQIVSNGDYHWAEIQEGYWIAINEKDGWNKLLEAEYDETEKLIAKIEELEIENTQLKAIVDKIKEVVA